ncbi:expressed unknown protein [Seminavis robusta]|uniref:Uncharacterized protein n=1 Tax=Seminavis robusta TaxID=568900 RepID=A0A9N8HH13_9STRA|nr:expressed unknown protein [Seminavis robusta]|eukprot:Sro425_g140210.1 n/a (379) ;mRNA; f:51325-52461
MKRLTVGKSRSFNVTRRTKSSSNKKMVHSYDDLHIHRYNTNHSHDGGNDSDSDSSVRARDPTMNSRGAEEEEQDQLDWSSWARSIGLPLAFSSASTSTTSSRRTKSQFQPSYLLQKRKEALVLAQQHQQSSLQEYFQLYASFRRARQQRHSSSCLALFCLLAACYALFTLGTTSTTSTATTATHIPYKNTLFPDTPSLSVPSTSTSTSYYYYYLNLKESDPLEMIAKMLTLHAYIYQLEEPHGIFAGVCGYPTFQPDALQQARQLLVELHLETLLQFDVCPPIAAIQTGDPHFVVLEEPQVDTLPRLDLFTPEWKLHMTETRQARWQQRQFLQQQGILQSPAATTTTADSGTAEEALWKQIIGETTEAKTETTHLRRR